MNIVPLSFIERLDRVFVRAGTNGPLLVHYMLHPGFFTFHAKGLAQIYHVVPVKFNFVRPNQILNKNPA